MRLLILPAVLLLVEILAYQLLKRIFSDKKRRWLYIGSMIFFYGAFISVYVFHDRTVGQTQLTLWANGLLLLNAICKFILAVVAVAEDLVRFPLAIGRKMANPSTQSFQVPGRRKFVRQMGLGLMAVPFIGILDGISFGRFRFRVIKQTLFFPDLPAGLEGYTIMQLSDMHLGSIDNPEHLTEAVRLINETPADLMVMTGDLVNTMANECDVHLPWLNQIRDFKDGKWAVLGNHDYGEYVKWETEQEKHANFEGIKTAYAKSGFTLLNNAQQTIVRNDDRLHLIGVENWGRNFIQRGDLDKATGDLGAEDFKVLLSHDPSHWEDIVRLDDRHFQLTLSGHTHGMQFGIEIPGIRWSPVQWAYKHWAGIYQEASRYIYVNRGFGYHAYPGRVGIWPEITVFELKKGTNVSS